jgi:RNA polymerase sigma-70 factor (ECF subfamily)
MKGPLEGGNRAVLGTVAELADEDSLPTRHSLLSRLRDLGDSSSWNTFFNRYWRLIYNVARKSGLSEQEAEDVVQETVIAVARKMPEFRYEPAKGSFKSWLLLICRRRIQDHFRGVYTSPQVVSLTGAETEGVGENVPDPILPPDAQMEVIWEQEWRENLLRTARARVRQRINPKHYQVFDCCVIHNQRPAAVAQMLGLNAAQVYLAKHRVSAAVKRAVKELEAELNGNPTSD